MTSSTNPVSKDQVVGALQPAPYNPRKISHEGLENLSASLKEFGDLSGVVRNVRTNRLVGGHQRVKILDPSWPIQKNLATDPTGTVALGYIVTPWGLFNYREVDWDEKKEIAANLSANKIRSEWDTTKLPELLVGSQLLLNLTGFTPLEIQKFTPPTEETPKEPLIEPPKNPVTKTGTVWELGPHRLLCGDCRDAADMRRLMNGAQIQTVITSPPYASQRKYDESSGFKPVHPDAYVEWFADVAYNALQFLRNDGTFFLNMQAHCEDGQRHLYVKDLTLRFVREWGWQFVDEFVWVHGGTPKAVINRFKNGWESVFQFSRGKFKFRPEAVRHFSEDIPDWPGGSPNDSWIQDDKEARKKYPKTKKEGIGGSQGEGLPYGGVFDGCDIGTTAGLAYPSNVLSLGKNREALGHSAAFPVSLPAFFIRAYTDAGDAVFDPFMGSGSTLMAAEETGRVAYGTEISPAYCDVIVRRWEAKTKKKATRAREKANQKS